MTPLVQMRSESGTARLTQNKPNWNQIKPVPVQSGHQDDDFFNSCRQRGELSRMPTTLAFPGSVIHYQTCIKSQRSGVAPAGSGSQLLEQEGERAKEKRACGWSCGSFRILPAVSLSLQAVQAISWSQQQKFTDLMYVCPLLVSALHHRSLLSSDGTNPMSVLFTHGTGQSRKTHGSARPEGFGGNATAHGPAGIFSRYQG